MMSEETIYEQYQQEIERLCDGDSFKSTHIENYKYLIFARKGMDFVISYYDKDDVFQCDVTYPNYWIKYGTSQQYYQLKERKLKENNQ